MVQKATAITVYLEGLWVWLIVEGDIKGPTECPLSTAIDCQLNILFNSIQHSFLLSTYTVRKQK